MTHWFGRSFVDSRISSEFILSFLLVSFVHSFIIRPVLDVIAIAVTAVLTVANVVVVWNECFWSLLLLLSQVVADAIVVGSSL